MTHYKHHHIQQHPFFQLPISSSGASSMTDAWKCYKHPSRRSPVGVCPTCLRDRLITLCPNCANSLPCSCFNAEAAASISAPSSSLSRLSVDSYSVAAATSRVSGLIDSDPSFQRSKSAAVQFRSSRFSDRRVEDEIKMNSNSSSNRSRPTRSTSSFWSVFGIFNKEAKSSAVARSKSVSVSRSSDSGSNKGWHFRSPMKVFQHSKPGPAQELWGPQAK